MKTNSRTIVFIHGLFVNPKSWTNWKSYFETKGYTCYSPANPYHEGEPKELRGNINPQLAHVNFEDVVNNCLKLIDSLTEKPIVIGHSLAGLVVQIGGYEFSIKQKTKFKLVKPGAQLSILLLLYIVA